jgi:hypothetical protein
MPSATASAAQATNRVPRLAAVVSSETPSAWLESALASIAHLEGIDLCAIVVDPRTASRRRSIIAEAILRVYGYADARAYPIAEPALAPTALREPLRAMLTAAPAVGPVDWVLDARDPGADGPPLEIVAAVLVRPRIELVADADASVLDAVRRRSPVASRVEVVDGGGCRVVAATVGAVEPLSVRRTLDAACRRGEVLLVRALKVLTSAS